MHQQIHANAQTGAQSKEANAKSTMEAYKSQGYTCKYIKDEESNEQ